MKSLGRVMAVARADFFERTRRYSYLIVLLTTVWATAMFLPPNHATYATLQFGGHRGIYNSAWIGSLLALLASVFLSLYGFFLVKNTIERDRATRVGPILAATSLGKMPYLFGKAISNFAVLASMVVVLALSAVVLQLTLKESGQIDLVALWLPLLLVPLPLFALTSALAVLFETVPWLRGGLGNVAYVFGWIMFLSISALGTNAHGNRMDPIGNSLIVGSMAAACAAAFPEYQPGVTSFSLGINIKGSGQYWDFTTFEWHGVHWSLGAIAARLEWVLFGIALTALASLWFDRFDDARGGPRERRGRKLAAAEAAAPLEMPGSHANGGALAANAVGALRPASLASPATRAFQLWPMWKAEFALLVRGQNVFWYIVALALIVLNATLPLSVIRQFILPISWIWPVLLWSSMGSRERREGTDGLLFSAARPISRQLPAAWLAGVSVAVLMGGGAAFRLAIAGDTMALAAWVAGALFIPSLALAMGVWTGGRKMFEVTYLLLWYCGPMQHTPTIDYIGTTASTLSWHTTGLYFAVAAALLTLAVWGRARQVRG